MEPYVPLLQGVTALIGVGIAVGSYLLARRTSTEGWSTLSYAGAFMAYWAIGSFFTADVSGMRVAVNIVGMSGFALFLSTAAVKIASDELPANTPDWFSVRNVKIYIIAVFVPIIVLGSLYGLSPELQSLLYYQNFGLLVPAVYGFYQLYQEDRATNWLLLAVTGLFGMVTVLAHKYTAAFCSTHYDPISACGSQATYFATQLTFPLSEPVLWLASQQYIWTTATVTIFGIGTYLFAKRMSAPLSLHEDGHIIERLIRTSADTVGGIIGYRLAYRIAQENLEDEIEGVEIQADDDQLDITIDEDAISDQTYNTVTEQLISIYEDHVGPVARRKIITVSEQLKATGDV